MKTIRLLAITMLAVLILGIAAALAAEIPALTMADAKAAALERALLDAEDVFWTKLSQDKEDGRQVFEIEFIAGEKEYEFDINVATGDIVKESTETVGKSKRTTDFSVYITMDEATEKALAQAGIDAQQAVFTEIEFDFEDGRATYELKFAAVDQTYEVELDAKTGAILKYEMNSGGEKK